MSRQISLKGSKGFTVRLTFHRGKLLELQKVAIFKRSLRNDSKKLKKNFIALFETENLKSMLNVPYLDLKCSSIEKNTRLQCSRGSKKFIGAYQGSLGLSKNCWVYYFFSEQK